MSCTVSKAFVGLHAGTGSFSITPTYVGVILDFDFYVSLMRFFSPHYDWIKI